MDIQKLLEFLMGRGALKKAAQTGNGPQNPQQQNLMPNFVQQEIARRLGGPQGGGLSMPPGPVQQIPQGLQGAGDQQNRLQQIMQLLSGGAGGSGGQ